MKSNEIAYKAMWRETIFLKAYRYYMRKCKTKADFEQIPHASVFAILKYLSILGNEKVGKIMIQFKMFLNSKYEINSVFV